MGKGIRFYYTLKTNCTKNYLSNTKLRGGTNNFGENFCLNAPPPVATGLHHGVVLIAQKRIGLSAACSASLAGLSAACSVSLAVNSASRVDNFASKALGLKQTDPATGGGGC